MSPLRSIHVWGPLNAVSQTIASFIFLMQYWYFLPKPILIWYQQSMGETYFPSHTKQKHWIRTNVCVYWSFCIGEFSKSQILTDVGPIFMAPTVVGPQGGAALHCRKPQNSMSSLPPLLPPPHPHSNPSWLIVNKQRTRILLAVLTFSSCDVSP